MTFHPLEERWQPDDELQSRPPPPWRRVVRPSPSPRNDAPRSKGAGPGPRYQDPDIIVGPKKPYWGCTCGLEANWACRVKCTCGRLAPSRVRMAAERNAYVEDQARPARRQSDRRQQNRQQQRQKTPPADRRNSSPRRLPAEEDQRVKKQEQTIQQLNQKVKELTSKVTELNSKQDDVDEAEEDMELDETDDESMSPEQSAR